MTDSCIPETRPRLIAIVVAGVLLAVVALMLAVPTAHAKPTVAQKCGATKNKAAGKYAACLQAATAAFVTKADGAKLTTARTKCQAAFLKAWAAADAKAAKAGGACDDAPLTVDAFDQSVVGQSAFLGAALAGDGFSLCGDGTRQGSEACDGTDFGVASCASEGFALGTLRCVSGCTLDTSGCFATRFADNGDGTVTDHQTGLQWEQKTTTFGSGVDLADPHDVDNVYALILPSESDAPLFTEFLAKLNGTSADGAIIAGCFVGHCDWRLPTVVELETIADATAGACGGGSGPCVAPIFGPTSINTGGYWSTTPKDGANTWVVDFTDGLPSFDGPEFGHAVRAVRPAS